MRVVAEPVDVVERIAGSLSGAEGGAADVHGVGAVVDGGNAGIGVAGRRKKFESVEGKLGIRSHGAARKKRFAGRGRRSSGIRKSAKKRRGLDKTVELGFGGTLDGALRNRQILGEFLVARIAGEVGG